MSDKPRLLQPVERDALDGSTVTILGTGMDALVFRTEEGMTVMATFCLDCATHLSYYEIDPSVLKNGNDLSSAG